MLESNLKNVIEAILLAAGKPMTEDQILSVFIETERPALGVLREHLATLQTEYADRSVELIQVASGYRFQVKQDYAAWVGKLSEEKPQKYSRALLETLALIAYRQPITRGEIEDIRGVSISTSIFKTLLEDREWIRMVGHKEVPGRPALYATTKGFLDYFGLKTLKDLPPLPEIMNLESMSENLERTLGPKAETEGDEEQSSISEEDMIEAMEAIINEESDEQIQEEELLEESLTTELEDEYLLEELEEELEEELQNG